MSTVKSGLGDVAGGLSVLEAKAEELKALEVSGGDSGDLAGDPQEPEGVPGERPREEEDQPGVQAEGDSTESPLEPDDSLGVEDLLNYKPSGYEVRGEKHEFEDWAKELIVDSETEQKFRDLYTRGHGLEIAKKERDEVKSQYQKVQGVLEKAETAYERGDMDQVMRLIGIEPKAVEDWVKKRQTLNELPDEQRKVYEQNQERERRYHELEAENRAFRERGHRAQLDKLGSDVDQLLQTDGAAFQAEYDNKVGRPGAFKKVVFDQGSKIFETEKRVATVVEATQAAIDLLGLSGATEVESSGESAPRVNVQAQKKPVIPNIGSSSGQSPVARRISSLDDLIKIKESMTV